MKKLLLFVSVLALHASAHAVTLKMASFTSAADAKKVFAAMKIAETSDGKRLETSDGSLECGELEDKKFGCALLLEVKKAEVDIVDEKTVRFSGKIAQLIWDQVDAKVTPHIGSITKDVANLSCWLGSNPRSRIVKCQARNIKLATVQF